jgi:excisionase family DNA binding protein
MNTDENSILPESQPEAVPEGQEAQPSELVGLVTMRQLARELNLPFKWLRRLVREGKLPVLKSGTRYLFDPITVARKIRGMAGYANQFGMSPEQYRYHMNERAKRNHEPTEDERAAERLDRMLRDAARRSRGAG